MEIKPGFALTGLGDSNLSNRRGFPRAGFPDTFLSCYAVIHGHVYHHTGV